MHRLSRLSVLAVAGALAFAPVAANAADPAAVYDRVNAAKNRIGFVFTQMGVPVEGHFRKSSINLAFDSAQPTKSSVRLELDLGSIDAGSSDANQEVVGKPWFDLKNFPTATFVSSAVKPLGGNRYEMSGQLTIKGRSRDVTTPVTITQRDATAVFEGGFTLKRLEFGIGDGSWSDTSIVADEVKVSFHVEAERRSTK